MIKRQLNIFTSIVFNLAIAFSVLFISSCSEDNWTEEEKNAFVNDCLAEGGTKKYCKCFMENAMNEYPIAEEAREIEFEEAVELSKNCK